LFLHLVLPYTLQYFKPRKFLRQAGLRVWKLLASQLRLSSYLFGGRHIDEESTIKRRWHLPRGKIVATVADGSFRRVPNSDNVALVKNEPAIAAVDFDGHPIDERAANLIQLQNAEAEKARRNIRDDYVVVYFPPHFRYRVIAFTAAIWIICSSVLAASVGLPVLLGRYFFKLFVSYHVHDGYSFLAGFYLLWACWLVSNAMDKMDKQRQRHGGAVPRADFALYLLKRSLLWAAQATYMALCLGVVIPTLIALVIELYIILPSRHAFNPDLRPRVRIADMWALGLLYTKVALRLQRIRPGGQIIRGIETVRT
jgi:E3 ubiquitin-protein ligase MARCH6